MQSHDEPEIELPEPSFWPILMAFSLLLIAVGIIYSLIVAVIGVLGLLACLAGWTLENRKPDEEDDEVDYESIHS